MGSPRADIGVIESDEAAFPEIVRRVRAVRGPAQQPVPGPARPLWRARHDRVAAGEPRCDGCRRRRPSSSTSTTRRWPRSRRGSRPPRHLRTRRSQPALISWMRFRMPRTPRRAGSAARTLAYDRLYSAHLGAWRCPGCGASRARRSISLERSIALDGVDALRLEVSRSPRIRTAHSRLQLLIPGLYNAYNAVAATAVASTLGVPRQHHRRALRDYRSAFGRIERVPYRGRSADPGAGQESGRVQRDTCAC